MKSGRLHFALLWIALFATIVGQGIAGRNGSGTFTIPNSFSPGTTISSSDMNENFSDIATEITNSVAVDGQSTMTGPLKAANGSQAAPSFTFGSDTDTGCWRKGANNMACGANNTEAFNWTGSAFNVLLPVSFSTGLGTSSIADAAITYAKIQNVSATNKLLGRFNSGAGAVEEIGLGTGISIDTGNLTAVAQLPRGYIDGCILSNNGSDATNDLDISAGVARDSTNAIDITCPAQTGKQLDANWAVGSAAGLRNSAAGITDTTYHIYVVMTAAGTANYYAHTSTTVATVLTALQAETGGSSYVYARRIGSIVRASSTILAFTQRGDEFELTTPVLDVNDTDGDTSGASGTLSSVPNGIAVKANINLWFNGVTEFYISPLTATNSAPSQSSAPLVSGYQATTMQVWTNTSRQIRYRTASNTTRISIATLGWLDRRGKDN